MACSLTLPIAKPRSFVYDGSEPIQVRDEDGATTYTRDPGGGLVSRRLGSGTASYYHHDAVGSVTPARLSPAIPRPSLAKVGLGRTWSWDYARYRPQSFVTWEGIAIGDQGSQTNPVFTIGHSNHSAQKLAGLLKRYGIEVLVDTRSRPYSRHAPHFNARAIEASLSKNGIEYLFLGRELGGRPDEEMFYDGKGRADYALIGRSRTFLDGISRLENEIRVRTVVLLCSEEDPARCHRRLLVGRTLEERGFMLRHIRGDGSVETEDEMNGGHPVLFPEAEASPRKSTRSVSRRRRRPSSSER